MSEQSAAVSFLKQLDWVRTQMPRTQHALFGLVTQTPVKIAISTHLDIKMVPVYERLLEAGCELYITTCDPNTVRDEVVEYLVTKGADAYAWQGMNNAEWRDSLARAIAWQPDYICEFGGELIQLYHQQNGTGLIGAMEGTGSGVAKIKQLNLAAPVLNWDDLDAKEGLHNRHMVGLTAWHAFFARTHLTLHEKRVTLLGYGLVGQGVAASARAYGGSVTVVERDPARRIMAAYDGLHVAELDDVIATTDVLVSATGAVGVLSKADLIKLKAGAFVLNVGHGTQEIDISGLSDVVPNEVMPFVYEYKTEGAHFYLLANGAMFNLTASFGDSLNAFDVTLSIMAGGLKYLLTDAAAMSKQLHLLPDEAWKPYLTQ